jgi:hypothetical protein
MFELICEVSVRQMRSLQSSNLLKRRVKLALELSSALPRLVHYFIEFGFPRAELGFKSILHQLDMLD